MFRSSPDFSRSLSGAGHAALARVGEELLDAEMECIEQYHGHCHQFMLPRVAGIFERARADMVPAVFRDLAAGINAGAARQSAATRAFHALQHAAGAGAVPGHVTEADLPALVARFMERNAAEIAATLPEQREQEPRGRRAGATAGAVAAAVAVLAACTALAAVVRSRRAAGATSARMAIMEEGQEGAEPRAEYTAAPGCTEKAAVVADV